MQSQAFKHANWSSKGIPFAFVNKKGTFFFSNAVLEVKIVCSMYCNFL